MDVIENPMIYGIKMLQSNQDSIIDQVLSLFLIIISLNFFRIIRDLHGR